MRKLKQCERDELHPSFKLYWVTVFGFNRSPSPGCLTNAVVVAHDEQSAISHAVRWAEAHGHDGDGFVGGPNVEFVASYAGRPSYGIVGEANGDYGVISVNTRPESKFSEELAALVTLNGLCSDAPWDSPDTSSEGWRNWARDINTVVIKALEKSGVLSDEED